MEKIPRNPFRSLKPERIFFPASIIGHRFEFRLIHYFYSMRLIIRLLVIAAIAYILSQVMPGIHIRSYGSAIWFAVVLGILNVFLRPLLIILTLPLTIFTLGLFLLVINTLMVMLAGEWINGFKIDNFGWGFLFSLLLTIITSALFREEDRQRKERRS